MKTTIGISLVAVCLLVWWIWPKPVTLDESQYDIAMALYRVCNQSSSDGLAKIEILIAENQAGELNASPSPLAGIVAKAKSGHWKEAAKMCRAILDDQIWVE